MSVRTDFPYSAGVLRDELDEAAGHAANALLILDEARVTARMIGRDYPDRMKSLADEMHAITQKLTRWCDELK